MLRCATWLSPGLPLPIFEVVAAAVADALGTTWTLDELTHASGPSPEDDPFARGEVDIGFMCTPSYRELARATPTSVRLAGAAPVFCDPRNAGRPVYFVELVVRGFDDASTLQDLRGARIGFNDERSLSGLLALREQLERIGADDSFVELVCTGGHRRSLEQLQSGSIDAASIDSNTLVNLRSLPQDLRVLETWGPYPVQPVVVRSSLDERTRAIVRRTLLGLHEGDATGPAMRRLGVDRFAAVTEASYR